MLVKVDIQSGRVLVDNLAAYWANSAGRVRSAAAEAGGARAAKSQAAASAIEAIDEKLMRQVKKFNARRKNKRWTDEELYRLLILSRRQNYAQAARSLNKSKRACQQMVYLMKKEPAIRSWHCGKDNVEA